MGLKLKAYFHTLLKKKGNLDDIPLPILRSIIVCALNFSNPNRKPKLFFNDF